jgi:hypothetical protein
MNAIGLSFTLVASALLLALPRRFAAVPLLLGVAYMTRGQELEIGPAHFTVVRLLVAVGFVRVLVRREHLANGMNAVDRWLLAWSVVLVGTSAFHASDAWVYRSGLVWTELGCYFLLRIFLSDCHDVVRVFKTTCLMLAPVAVLMLMEKATRQNAFGPLGGVNQLALVRDGLVRASGPFAHPILAGTVGATCIGMALCLWRQHRKHALLGVFGGSGIVAASTSSGPVLMAGFIALALLLWPLRRLMALIRWLFALGILALAAVMNDPVYFLIARIDITGSSQGYFRAQLIRSSIEHLDEWWLAGTDYTRHWMATGMYANNTHTDITNHILAQGVMGGLLLMFLFVAMLVAAFRGVGRALRESQAAPKHQQFVAWTLGALLFGYVVNFTSISLFDQSIVFFYLILAGIGAVRATVAATSIAADRPGAPVPPRRQMLGMGHAAKAEWTPHARFERRDAA